MTLGKDWTRLFSTRVYPVFAVITIVNFIAFGAIAFYLGGDAGNGKVEGGRYYLFGMRAENGVKVYTEVSKAKFTYSKFHVYSVFITWPLLLIGGAANNYLKKRSHSATPGVSHRFRMPSRDWRTVYLHEIAIYEVFVLLVIVGIAGTQPFWFFAVQSVGHLFSALISNKFYWWYGRKAALGLSRVLMILAGVGWIAAGYLFGR
jgi:hypothetical protein